MALTANSFVFVYPQYLSTMQNDKVGGYPTDIPVSEPNVLGERQLFNFAVLYGSSYVQYQKIFIKNTGDEDALNVSVYGENVNSNSIMKMALEVGQDQQIIYSGQEQIKNNATEPHLYDYYTFQEISSGSPLSIANVPSGKAVGIWLKLEFSSIDAYNEADEFLLGINFEGVAGTPFNAEKTIGHSRIDASVDIIRVQKAKGRLRSLEITYDWIDTTALGIVPAEAIYAIYIDRIFVKESTGGRAIIKGYASNVPLFIEVYLLPYSTYRPVLDVLTADKKNRIQVNFQGRNPNVFDVDYHFVYWDNATGDYLSQPILKINAENGNGGGAVIQKCELVS